MGLSVVQKPRYLYQKPDMHFLVEKPPDGGLAVKRFSDRIVEIPNMAEDDKKLPYLQFSMAVQEGQEEWARDCRIRFHSTHYRY